jgi:3-methyl-2-oxobutanoate hydroxymethyltransferase
LKTTLHSLIEMKSAKKKITMLTAYDYPTAKLLDESDIDIILVGDSLGNAVLGYENTIPVTMEDMLHHTKAVARGVKRAMLIADMPFMSFHLNPEQALLNASKFVKECGAIGVKIEGDNYLDAVKKIVDAGIPVMGHVGFTPQSVNQLGGYRVQGRTKLEGNRILAAAKALEKAGAFAIVLEMVPPDIAKRISQALDIPVIGCGGGAGCDGQVLVLTDLLGLTTGCCTPKFVKRYADLNKEIKSAVSAYISDVRSGKFPGKENTY